MRMFSLVRVRMWESVRVPTNLDAMCVCVRVLVRVLVRLLKPTFLKCIHTPYAKTPPLPPPRPTPPSPMFSRWMSSGGSGSKGDVP